MSGLGVSIKRPKVEEEVKNTATATITPQTAQPEEDYIFNERDINYYWQEYAGRMPKEQVAIAIFCVSDGNDKSLLPQCRLKTGPTGPLTGTTSHG